MAKKLINLINFQIIMFDLNHNIEILVGIDRDNTINQDIDSYFGSQDNWREKLEFVPGAIEGLRMLSENPKIALAVLSNQVGIARGVLTETRVQEINQYMNELLTKQGVNIDSWKYCPFSSLRGARRWKRKGVETINYNYVLEKKDLRSKLIKPEIGMISEVVYELGLITNNLSIYVMGDRHSDVRTGTNAGGSGILVNSPNIVRSSSSFNRTNKRVNAMIEDPKYSQRVHIVTSLIEAAQIILR